MMGSKTRNNQEVSPFIKLKKEDTNQFINLIKEQFGSKPIIEYKYIFIKERDYILIPLNQKSIKEIEHFLEGIKLIDHDIVYRGAIKNPKFKYKTIEDVLHEEAPKWSSNLIPKSYDIIGSIAVVEFPNLMNLSNKERVIFKIDVAKAILLVNKSINTVYEKASQIKGKYRLRNLQLLYGIDDPETIHRENYAVFKVNLKKAYFTPRLVTERKRIVESPIAKGELIVDMFAGVGPFSIQIAKKHDVQIYAFDINLDAYKYLKENICLNRVESKVFPYNIDTKILLNSDNKLANSLKGKVDRIIMNLPEKSLDFLEIACYLIKKSGGIIHNYQFCSKPNPGEQAIKQFSQILTQCKYQIKEIIHVNTVKSYSPISDLISLDVEVISK